MIEDDDGIWGDDDKQFRRLLERHPLYKDHSYGRLIRAVADEAKKRQRAITTGGLVKDLRL